MSKPHKHAQIISEWTKDTSRVVEVKSSGHDWQITNSPKWDEDREYRFAEGETKKSKIRSSLTDHECELFAQVSARELADAAAQRSITDLSLPSKEWIEYFLKKGDFDVAKVPTMGLMVIVVIGCYLEDVKKGIM
jgi:hypothetical protein